MAVEALTLADILQQLQQRKAHWQARYGVTRIGVFGSMARGEATAHSDIDVGWM
jgi:predicted nucleotidyltransferase